MSLGELSTAYAQAGDIEDRVWGTLAYVGRYGHQPFNTASQLPVRALNRLARKIAEIVEKENASGKPTQE